MRFLSFAAVLLAIATAAHGADVQKVSSAHAAKLVNAGLAVLVDCREPEEWAETGVAVPAVLLAKSDFDGERKAWKPFLEQNGRREIILYCRSGNRAGKIAAKLADKGLNVSNAGGLKDWIAAGLPVRKVEPAQKSEEKK